ncbi:EthD family reductase [Streptomyces carpinensis]|uniref:EthD family reductase n=1 Tax=Streptomyces carpinensis TaxID=66369 RepID=A0ABV1W0N1_9ACTN|nr:EthD family reductase [Streptomyces carpinensis]
MIKLVAVVRRKEDIGFEEFRHLWCEEHAQLVLPMPGVRRYTQNLAFEGRTRTWPVDGVAEVWFDDKRAVREAFASEAGAAATEHEKTFAGEVTWFLAEEIAYEWGAEQ